MAVSAGERLGPYELIGKIGAGGMGNPGTATRGQPGGNPGTDETFAPQIANEISRSR